MSFHVGQLVVCVKAPQKVYGENRPRVGGVYTVRDIDAPGVSGDRPCIWLLEVVNPPRQYADGYGEVSFWVERFRPVDETRIAIFRKMLAPTPKTTVDA